MIFNSRSLWVSWYILILIFCFFLFNSHQICSKFCALPVNWGSQSMALTVNSLWSLWMTLKSRGTYLFLIESLHWRRLHIREPWRFSPKIGKRAIIEFGGRVEFNWHWNDSVLIGSSKAELWVKGLVSIRCGLQIGPGSCFLWDFKVKIDVECCGQSAGIYLSCKSKLLACARGT